MKFLCPNCKAKYQISDEKIVGRTLKMDCRRCSHPIVIRGDKLAAEAEPAEPARKPASRPGSGSHVGPAPSSRPSSRTALGADFRKNAGAAAAPAKPTALDQWHVAIHDVPVGPMKRDEVAQKIGAGAVTGESLCWREGFDDWRPLREVPELAELLRRAAAPPPPSRGLPRAAPPGGAPRPARPPAQRAQGLPAQSSRPAEPARPAARGNVVPIGGRLGAAAAPAVEDFSEDAPDDEPTRVGSSLDLIRAEEERLAEEAARKKADRERKEEEDARARRAEEEARRDAAERDAAAAAAPTAAFAEEDAFDPFASQRAPVPSSAVSSPSSPAVFTAPTQPLPPSASYAAPLSEAPARRRGLPVGAWIAIAGAMAFGATLAVMFGIKMFGEPVAPVAMTTPEPTTEPAGPRDAVPDPTLTAPAEPDPVADPPVAEDTAPSDPTPAQPATNAPRTPREGGSTTPRESTTTTPNSARPLDPEAAARLAQFEDDGAGAAPINVRDRNNPLAEDTQRGTGELSQEQIRTVVNRERSTVQRCWETAIRAAGQSPGVRIDVDLTIGSSGTVTSATARGPGFGTLTDCIERTVRRWRFPASGGSSRLSIPFVFQAQD